jgi:transposase
MIRPDINIDAVYLYRKPVDMRCQMTGLSALVEGVMQKNPFSGALFVFINKARDKLKILCWQTNGFVVYYKRLEAEKFSWPLKEENETVNITGQDLHWLLEGYNIFDLKPHKKLNLSIAS